MKKILFLAALIACAVTSNAQAVTQLGTTKVATNATTTFVGPSRIYGDGTLGVQLNLKKGTGTVSGYAILQASIDNNLSPVNFFDVNKDTVKFVDGNNCNGWAVPSNWLHYRVKVVTTGTQSDTLNAFYYLKPNH